MATNYQIRNVEIRFEAKPVGGFYTTTPGYVRKYPVVCPAAPKWKNDHWGTDGTVNEYHDKYGRDMETYAFITWSPEMIADHAVVVETWHYAKQEWDSNERMLVEAIMINNMVDSHRYSHQRNLDRLREVYSEGEKGRGVIDSLLEDTNLNYIRKGVDLLEGLILGCQILIDEGNVSACGVQVFLDYFEPKLKQAKSVEANREKEHELLVAAREANRECRLEEERVARQKEIDSLAAKGKDTRVKNNPFAALRG